MARKLIRVERNADGEIVALECTACGKMKPPGEFFRGDAAHGRRMPCKACRRPLHAAAERRRRNDNPEVKRVHDEGCKRWAAANTAYERARSRRRWRTDPVFRARAKRAASAYARAHPAYFANAAHRRRVRDRAAGSTLSMFDVKRIFDAHDNACIYCGRSDVKLTIEHLVPPPVGSHDFDNVVPACKPCNSRKHDRTLADYFARFGGKIEFCKRRTLGLFRLRVGMV